MAETRQKAAPRFNDRERSVLKVVFVTLFLDLIGFSIIFPLYPSMLAYYLEVDGGGGLLGGTLGAIHRFQSAIGGAGASEIVLFGGILGSIYSLLQFVCAPILGSLSDRFGRRPILFISIAGIGLSYLVWFFAGYFWVLVAARLLGGIMSGNISTASAAVADVTSHENRSKGMALIGVAFGTGFILGPAIGGIASLVDLSKWLPSLAPFGVNPFSFAALVAFSLSALNLYLVWRRFPETLEAGRRSVHSTGRTFNIFALFGTQGVAGVTRTNLAYFIFITAFSGVEFSLTFLAFERFGYTAALNALMLVYVGLILATVQGSYVQRRSRSVGERRMAVHGFLIAIPGIALVGFAQHPALLYAGLLLLATGSAQIIPCLTGLVSLYTPIHEQGRILGIFRSLGALARAIGPLIFCVIYWRLGSETAYYLGAALILFPLFMVRTLPDPLTPQKAAERH